MTPGQIGLLFGLAVAVVNYALMSKLASRLAVDKTAKNGARTARLIKLVAIADLFLFPFLGYVLAPTVMQ